MPKKKSKPTTAQKKQNKRSVSTGAVVTISVCSVLLLLVLIVAGGCLYLYGFDFNGTILENVSIAGVDVGGMTRQEAVNAVNNVAHEYGSNTMTVKVFDTQVDISPAVSGAELNVKAAVWDAYRYGRSGFAAKQEADKQVAAADGIVVDITPYLSLNNSAVKDALSEFENHYNTTLSQSTYEVTGTAPELTLVVNLGVPEYGLNLDAVYQEVKDAYSRRTFLVETQCDLIPPEPIDLQAILDQYATTPVDASYTETFEVQEGKNGCGFDKEAVQAKLDATAYGETVEIPFDVIAPENTAESLSAMLYKDTLGTHTATQSSSSNRQTNLRLACEAVNGVILYPGDIFSYNETLGERTAEKGYKPGASYNGDETVSTIGGGICQVSSTLYYCALQADLKIIERECHRYAAGYVPLGMDATVNWGTLDFSFQNDKDYPIRIDAVADGGSVTISLVGTDTKDYYIKMEYVVTAYYTAKTTYKTMAANNPEGYKDGDYITTPYNGYDVTTYRCKYSKATNELISKEKEAVSEFARRDAVICKIEGASGSTDTGTNETLPGIGNGQVTEG
ncbi:MAG: VanW family protein [Oscillospiraceae bacterium]|nr:VanW family protein [Oscillospiraceae bacterium]